MHTYRFLGFTSQPSRHLRNVISCPGDISVFSAQKVNLWIKYCDINNQLSKNNFFFIIHKFATKDSTYFFCVSPALILILRTSRTFLFCELDHDQIDDLRCFKTDDQESEGPSQRREIFSRSPMSSSVKTRNVFVRFRPTPSALWKQRSQVRSSKNNCNLQKNPYKWCLEINRRIYWES